MDLERENQIPCFSRGSFVKIRKIEQEAMEDLQSPVKICGDKEPLAVSIPP